MRMNGLFQKREKHEKSIADLKAHFDFRAKIFEAKTEATLIRSTDLNFWTGKTGVTFKAELTEPTAELDFALISFNDPLTCRHVYYVNKR
jgi:hypothetical protein